MARIVQLDVADPPEVWRDLGFTVVGCACTVGGVRHALLGPGAGKGVVSWTLAGLPGAPPEIDGLVTKLGDEPISSGPDHANFVTAIDHVVVATPDVDRTTSAIEATGLRLRRRRDGETHGRAMRQAFFTLDGVILEVVGPPEAAGDGPARFLGLAFTSSDLDATAAALHGRVHPPKPAVQPGRHIATLDRGAGTSVAMAFMSPEA